MITQIFEIIKIIRSTLRDALSRDSQSFFSYDRKCPGHRFDESLFSISTDDRDFSRIGRYSTIETHKNDCPVIFRSYAIMI